MTGTGPGQGTAAPSPSQACLLSHRPQLPGGWEAGYGSQQEHPRPCCQAPGKAHLLGEVLDDAMLGHLGADGKAALQLLLDAAQQLLVLLAGKALHPCGQRGTAGWEQGAKDLSLPMVGWRDGQTRPLNQGRWIRKT